MKPKTQQTFSVSHPLVTFCMPVYNRPGFVRSAIESMLAQTYPELEVIVVDDGSTDETPDVVEAFDDSRVRLIRRERNAGNLVCRNIAFDEAQGDYIAVMDSDDLCHPERAAMQIKTLANGFDLCGTCTVQGRSPHKIMKSWTPPEFDPELSCNTLFGSPFANPSTMMTREFLKSQNYQFDPEFFPAADYHALAKAVMFSDARVSVVQMPLVFRRWHRNAISTEKEMDQKEAANRVREMLLQGLGVDDKDIIQIHNNLVNKIELSTDDRLVLQDLYFSILPKLKPKVFATATAENTFEKKFEKKAIQFRANRPAVSIIVPVYNTSKYLRACVNSAFDQGDLRTEIILVDDGSTDDSSIICEEISQKYSEVKLVTKSNGGLSSARNAGMKIAQGEFVYFLDSDDLVVPNTLSKLLKLAHTKEVDVVVGSHDIFFDDSEEQVSRFAANELQLYNKNLLTLYSNNKFGHPAWNKLIKRRIAERLTFQIGLLHEDELYCFELFSVAKSVVVSPDVTYLYRQRPGSITSEITEKHVRDSMAILNTVVDRKQRLPLTERGKADYSSVIAMKSRLLVHKSHHFEPSSKLLREVQESVARAEACAVEGQIHLFSNMRENDAELYNTAELNQFAQLEGSQMLTDMFFKSVQLNLKDIAHLDQKDAARLAVLVSGAENSKRSINSLFWKAQQRRFNNLQLVGYALRHNGPGKHIKKIPRWMRAWVYVLSLKRGNAPATENAIRQV